MGWPQAMRCYARCLDVSFPCEYPRLSTGVGHHEELPCWLTPTFHDAFRSHSLAFAGDSLAFARAPLAVLGQHQAIARSGHHSVVRFHQTRFLLYGAQDHVLAADVAT
jgi:hypothetical protein